MQKTTLLIGLITLLLAGCRTDEYVSRSTGFREVLDVDTTPDALMTWLSSEGYSQSLITGRRTEDCARADMIGYGVILKTGNTASSAVVCQDVYGKYRIIIDPKGT